MPTLTGGQIVAKTLRNYGVEYVAGIPGHGIWSLTDAFLEDDSRIPFVQVFHEQSAVHLADGYYRATGKPIAAITSIGAGASNTVIGMGTAFTDSTSALVITGGPPTHMRGHGLLQELERYTDTIYLSQTSERRDGVITRHLNLADAIADWKRNPGGEREWRTHFHVPVFLDDLGPFRTTRFAIEQALAVHAAQPQSTHLEIETYTWDVLPAHLKSGDVVDYVVRELEFVRDTLLKPAPASEGLTSTSNP